MKSILKRDGRIAPFEEGKIANAILKAITATQTQNCNISELISSIMSRITLLFPESSEVDVESVQEIVEDVLMASPYKVAAKAYIRYRFQHKQIRDKKAIFEKGFELVQDYLGKADWRINENSNMDFSLQGLNHYIASAVTANYWLQEIYPDYIRDAHEKGELHIHDLSLLSPYCCGWDLMDLLLIGFGGVAGKIESSPPRHFRSALGQIVNFFFTLQGETAGAQAFSSFDTLLAPFVFYDQLSFSEVKQAIQEFVFNLNVPTRVGFQTPFTNLTMDLIPPEGLKQSPVVIGGEILDKNYSQFQNEMDMINEAFCQVMMAGDAKGRIFTFPIPTYNITAEFNWEDGRFRSLWEMTAKYGVPYFANFVNSDLDVSDARSMCCRLRLDNRVLRKRGGGLFASNPMTGSIGVVTLNLSRLGYRTKGEKTLLFQEIGRLLDIARDSLRIKRKIVERFTEKGLYPYAKHYLEKIKKGQGFYWGNHFNTIGVLGMNECLLNFMDKDIASEEGKAFAEDILTHIRTRLFQFQTEEDTLYNLEATPGESTSYRFAKIDKAEFPTIKTAGKAVPFYTNSTHLSVDYTPDIFEALIHQDSLQILYTGGTVLHGFLGEKIDNPLIARKLVRKICTEFQLPYFTLTPTFSICPEHGYIRGEHHECPVTK